jgi:UDP-N-acetyl-D-glucosamine/UDP-N-acetyl-D-galactosamine dehydrogenase
MAPRPSPSSRHTSSYTDSYTDPRASWKADLSDVRVAVIGLGYVGLPVAAALAAVFPGTIGIDIAATKVAAINSGRDPNGELTSEAVTASGLMASTDVAHAAGANFYVIAVPTDIDVDRRPDLRPLMGATRSVASVLSPGDVVVYESTVYPGLTEGVCGPLIAEVSGLRVGPDVFLGYSPERINPGDEMHTLATIVKVVAAQDATTLERVARLYERVVSAGVHRAPTIEVAEAAKVIENTQRDLNIALVNELAIIFDRMGIRTADVLEAAGTKWNFLPFQPGLVGGHCIGIDPYYLTTRAEQLGYHPDVILAGRRINNGMGSFIAQKTVKLLLELGLDLRSARVTMIGITFKEDVRDVRNSRAPDIVRELRTFGVRVDVVDPMADADEVERSYDVTLADPAALAPADAVILAVAHSALMPDGWTAVRRLVREDGLVIDVKSRLDSAWLPRGRYWSL